MANGPLRVACIGMGWWSDVLADAIKRSGKLEIASCYTRSEDKRQTFAAKYGCQAVAELRSDPRRSDHRGDHQHHAERRRIWRRRARRPRPASTSSSTSRSPIRCPKAAPSRNAPARPASCSRSAISGGAKAISARSGSRSTPASSASSSMPRPISAATGSAQIDLTSWRYQAAGMPGGVMLQIGIHYTDVLEYLMGPIKAVSGRLAQLVLPGDNPDVASLCSSTRTARSPRSTRAMRRRPNTT